MTEKDWADQWVDEAKGNLTAESLRNAYAKGEARAFIPDTEIAFGKRIKELEQQVADLTAEVEKLQSSKESTEEAKHE